MDDNRILQHLLDLEKQAAALVNNAQDELDLKVSEGEKQNRLRSEELYAGELEVQEKTYIGNIAAARENYRVQLEEYRESLKTQPVNPVYTVNPEAFNNLAKKFLIGTLVTSPFGPVESTGSLNRKA